MIFRGIMTVLFLILFFIPICHGSEIGKIYAIKFDGQGEKQRPAYYEMTTYLYQAMHQEGVMLYSEYQNLDVVHIWLSKKRSYAKLEKVISAAKSNDIKMVIDHGSTLWTPLHKMFSGHDFGEQEAVCQIHKIMAFDDADDAWTYLLKMQDLIHKRGHPIGMSSVGKTKKAFEVTFDFFGDCASKELIVRDLLKNFVGDERN